MKKCCQITIVHSAFDVRIFHKEAKTLAKNGYDVTLIAQHNKNEIVDGIKIIALPRARSRFFRIFFLTLRTYKIALREKADIYHFHDPELLPWMAKLKKKTGAKIIYDVHEDLPKDILSKEWIPGPIRKLVARLSDWVEKIVSQKFDYVIAATPDIRKKFKKHVAIDIKNYPIVEDFNLPQELPFPKNENYYNLVYAGGLTKNRGVKEIIEALKFINPKYNIRLRMIGRFSDRNFEKEVEKLREGSKVDFLGWLSQKEVFRHLLESDIGLVCLHPLEQFLVSLPIKMFEYALAGLPVIASDFPLWRKIIEGNNCGLCVDSLDPKKIAKAVEYLITHPEEAKKMGENGRRAVLEKYNWDSEAKKLLKVYEAAFANEK